MLPTATLTSKGQVTLPKEIRDRLSLRAGHQLSFEIDTEGTLVVRAKTVDLMSLGGILRRLRRKKSLRQLEAGIGLAAAKRHRASVR